MIDNARDKSYQIKL